MVFSSLTFLFVFLPLTLGIYYLVPTRYKNAVLFASGIIFYAWGEPIYVWVMVLSTLIDYTAGRMMHRFDDHQRMRTVFLLVSIIMNLGLLGVFKYSSFVVENLNPLFSLNLPDPNLPLPIGISFFTFQSMSYTIDLYRRKIKVQKNLITFTTYVTLFPQIVAGPIVRYSEVADELEHRVIGVNTIADGIGIFIKGLAKKVILANSIGAVWTAIKAMDYAEISTATAWIGILAFTFQIYYDFSGYSDMAKGLGRMLGFHFPDNFKHPYISRSVSEFWRRWHITMSEWFKSYVYFPLGGSRCAAWKKYRNIFIVWMLTGLWHGASWNFVLWGLYFGVLLILERLFLQKLLDKLPRVLQTAYTFLLVVFGWVLFEMTDLSQLGRFFSVLFGISGTGFADHYAVFTLLNNLVLFILCAVGSTTLADRMLVKMSRKYHRTTAVVLPILQTALFLVCIAFLVNATYNPFLYFNF